MITLQTILTTDFLEVIHKLGYCNVRIYFDAQNADQTMRLIVDRQKEDSVFSIPVEYLNDLLSYRLDCSVETIIAQQIKSLYQQTEIAKTAPINNNIEILNLFKVESLKEICFKEITIKEREEIKESTLFLKKTLPKYFTQTLVKFLFKKPMESEPEDFETSLNKKN